MVRSATIIGLAAASVSWVPARAPSATAQERSPSARPTAWAEQATLGSGRKVRIEYNLRGPLPPGCPKCPQGWVRIVVVKDAENPSRVLARWESESPDYPTSIPWFYPQYGHVWHAGHPAQTLITVEVPYGAKVSYLYALQWIGGKLYEVGRVGSDAGFSFSRRKSDGALIITRLSGARVDIPTEITQFYVWNGLRFYDGSREFPGFYERLAAPAAQVIEGPGDKSAIELVQSCTIALKAHDYAGSPAAGVTLCREALDRLLTGRGVSTQGLMKVNGNYAEDLKRHAQAVRQEIDEFLQRHPGLKPN